ncbi:glycosyltransferase family 4 protein [Ciceribacter sp. L1K22]|uniref:glycosyltransferase family 4 protein n=1 Tax=Ciceribacter sp. L1K22 TaxID=2820275 RepID=UPI001ABE19D8|nr:glycosyltransferase family 4 protein [Ciceribacter sp. L1K22]MBO3759791.1 glycosyltransferase family 4 protein [Ciceribacter sp. L1K22]
MSSEQPLRIIHCFRSPVGGIFRHVRDLAEQHSKAGHEVGIVCDSSTGGEHEERLFEQIRPYLSLGLTRLPIRRSVSVRDVRAVWDSYKTIKSLRPDVLHGHGAKGGVLARAIGSVLRVERYRVARVYSPHGGSLHFDPSKLSGRAVFFIERRLERLTDQLLFVCGYEQSVYESKIGNPRCPAQVVYNGIGEQDLSPVPTGPDGASFLYVGMLRDLKGPDVFVDAFARAERAVGHPLSALIIGDGPDRERYERMRTQMGLGLRIDMLPAMPVRDAFARSDIVVVPSRAEAMPYIVLEALGAGKVVIATRVGGIPEVLGEDSEALVAPGSSEELSRVMAKALTSPEWARSIMPDAKTFRARFSASTMAADVMEVYRSRLKTD